MVKNRIPTQFINLLSDFGFKRAFGTRRFQKNVLQLLEATLGDEIQISKIVSREYSDEPYGSEKVKFHNKEVIPAEEDGKRIIYDVYFTLAVPEGDSHLKTHHL